MGEALCPLYCRSSDNRIQTVFIGFNTYGHVLIKICWLSTSKSKSLYGKDQIAEYLPKRTVPWLACCSTEDQQAHGCGKGVQTYEVETYEGGVGRCGERDELGLPPHLQPQPLWMQIFPY